MDRAHLRQLVKQSTILSAEEQEYWLKHLSTMTKPQCRKLEEILAAPDEMPFQAELETYFAALNRAAVAALKQGATQFAA